jgi:hypothetical protein
MYSLLIALVLFGVDLAALTFAFRRIAGWGAIRRPGLWPSLLAVVACHLPAVAAWLLVPPYLADDDDIGPPITFFVCVWLFALPAFFLLGNRALWGTAKRWIAFGLPVAAAGLAFFFVVEEFVLQTERVHVSTMMPTIRGRHSVQPCPECGGEFAVTLFPARGRGGDLVHDDRFRKHGVCANCFHSEDVSEQRGEFYGVDHYLVNHLLPPARWRIAAFRNRSGRISHPRLGRVVGLPGEEVFIRDGAVWVNGERLTPPAEVGPLRYDAAAPRVLLEMRREAGIKDDVRRDGPVKLAADEYFVLQDEPGPGIDSRLDGPYRGKDYLGRVEVIFWPPRRWRLLS